MRSSRSERCGRYALWIAMCFACSAVEARDKTDVIKMRNGDHVTGEILELQYGALKLKTDDMGTIAIEWDAVASISSQYSFNVEQIGGRRTYGVLNTTADLKYIVIGSGDESAEIEKDRVTRIDKLERTFWSRIDGSFSVGYDYAKSTDIAVQNLQFNATYRAETVAMQLTASANSSKSPDTGTLDRDSLGFNYKWLRANRNFWAGLVNLERNEELGIDNRIQVGGGFGRYVYQSPHSEITAFAGAAVNRERVIGEDEVQESAEGILGGSWRIFRLESPKTSLNSELVLYPNLSDTGRYRGHADVSLRHELIKDFFVDLSFYYDYDSEPAGETAETDDYGVTTSLGYSF